MVVVRWYLSDAGQTKRGIIGKLPQKWPIAIIFHNLESRERDKADEKFVKSPPNEFVGLELRPSHKRNDGAPWCGVALSIRQSFSPSARPVPNSNDKQWQFCLLLFISVYRSYFIVYRRVMSLADSRAHTAEAFRVRVCVLLFDGLLFVVNTFAAVIVSGHNAHRSAGLRGFVHTRM